MIVKIEEDTMAWYVVAQDQDGTEHRIHCAEAAQVAEQFIEQRRQGRKVRIEEVDGKEIGASTFGIDGNIA